MNIGQRIKQLRLNKNLKQSELAEKSGLSRVAIGNYERGDRNPNIETLRKIADALNISLDVLLWDDTKFMKDLLSSFQSAYMNNKNYFPNEYEIISKLIDNEILSEKKTDISPSDFNNLSSDDMQKILDYIKQLDINIYTKFLTDKDLSRIKIIGNNILKQRNKNNMSRDNLAVTCRLDSSYLEKLENGFSDYPPNDILRNISTTLGVNVTSLIYAESFGYEILSRAIQIALKELNPYSNDVFMILGHYADSDTLIKFYNGIVQDLPQTYIKGILKYISHSSKEEFNKLFNDLVSTDIYNLDSELKDYCQKLYINAMNPLDFMDVEDKEFLQLIDYVQDGKLSVPQKKSDNKNIVSLGNGFFTLDSIKTPFACKEHIANLINYKIKDFDFNTLTNEDFDTILKDTLDFIEYEIYKIKNTKS